MHILCLKNMQDLTKYCSSRRTRGQGTGGTRGVLSLIFAPFELCTILNCVPFIGINYLDQLFKKEKGVNQYKNGFLT